MTGNDRPGASAWWPASFLAAGVLAWWITLGAPDYFFLQSLLITAGGLAIATVAQTFVLVNGSQGLGGGAMISLVNVLVVFFMRDDPASMALWIVAGPALGAVVGVLNGVLVGYLGLSSVAVTLATSFAVYGTTLLFLDVTAPPAPDGFMRLAIGEAVPGIVPASLLILAGVGVGAFVVLRSRLGRAVRAVGRDPDAARAAGIDVAFTRLIAHVLAGAGYGLAGVFVAGVTGSADPLIGAPTVLQIYAAAAIGGIGLGGGRGGPLGAILGALVVGSVTSLLFIADIDAYWSTAGEGLLLLIGLLLSRSFYPFVPAGAIRQAWRDRLGGTREATPALGAYEPEPARRLAPPAIAFVVVVIGMVALSGETFRLLDYASYLLASTVLLAIVAAGQATVLSTRGIDISLPATMALSASLFATLTAGSDRFALLGVPAALALGGAIGALNGGLVALLGIRSLFVTLAITGVLQGAVIDLTMLSTERFVSAGVVTVLTGSVLGVPNLAFVLVGFAIAVVLAMDRTTIGSRLRAAALQPPALAPGRLGVALVSAHAIAGLCAGLAGVLGSIDPAPARFGVGDTYLLPSVAAAVLGGVAVTGGRGRIVGAVLGALLITAVQILLERVGVHYGFAQIAIAVLLLAGLVAGTRAMRH